MNRNHPPLAAVVLIAGCLAASARAAVFDVNVAGTTYTIVEADPFKSGDTVGNTVRAVNPATPWANTSTSNTDSLWRQRTISAFETDYELFVGATDRVYEIGSTDRVNAPELVTSVSGLDPHSYDVYVVYITRNDGNTSDAGLLANLNASATTLHDHSNNEVTLSVGPNNAWHTDLSLLGSVHGTSFSANVAGSTAATADRNDYVGLAYVKRPFIASFDLNDAGDLNDNQTGWVPLNADLTTDTAVDGGVTFTFTSTNSAGSGRDRGTGGNVASSDLPNVYRDFTFADSLSGEMLTVELSGLLADKMYELRWYHYELGSTDPQNRLAVYQDVAIPANLLFETGRYDATTDPDVVGFTDFFATADAGGTITLVTGAHSGGRSIQMLNGFQVLSVVPTPSALPAGLALLGIAATRRRR